MTMHDVHVFVHNILLLPLQARRILLVSSNKPNGTIDPPYYFPPFLRTLLLRHMFKPNRYQYSLNTRRYIERHLIYMLVFYVIYLLLKRSLRQKFVKYEDGLF